MLLYEWLKEAATSNGGAKALVYRDTYLSWRGLVHRVERRAGEFASMGIRPGDWVGIMLGNVPDFVILTLALSKLGAVVVPLDPTTSPAELDAYLTAAPMRGLITRPRGSESAPARRPLPSMMRPARPAPPPESRRRLQGTLLTCSIYDAQPTAIDPQAYGLRSPGDLCLVQFTATSTGASKGVLRTRDNLVAGVNSVISTLKVDASDRVLAAAPLFLAYGFDMSLLVAMRTGATLFLEDEASPKRVMKLLREQEISFFPGAPPLYGPLARMPTARPLKAKGLRYLAAGEPLDDGLANQFLERLGVRILPHYHTTETGAVACERKVGPQAPVGVGKPFDGVEVLVADGEGNPVAAGQRGAIWVRSASVSPGAVIEGEAVTSTTAARSPDAGRKPNGTRKPAGRAASGKPAAPARAKNGVRVDGSTPIGKRDKSGWFRTGDLGHMDRSGRLFLEGREDDLVKVEGKRVALSEVERCIRAFPKVAAAKAFTFRDPLSGSVVVARVVARGSCQAEELLDHCARNLAPYKVPRRIEFAEES